MRIYFFKGVPECIKKRFLPFLYATKYVTKIKHKLRVSIVSTPCLQTPTGGIGVGCFLEQPSRIYICAGIIGFYKDYEFGWENFLDTFCHELAHYEQWRDGQPVQERGVRVRAKTLYKLLYRILDA